ncbi:MAG: hypothetical protein BAJALOKI2v1_150023 [Promethearchaeota archaeon]|nr:MAG: hypothetical protein BAJALOKI2v1_150023 [Candidatus Lokiarchaeota archaeon]
MSALTSFAGELSETGLRNFELDKKRFTIKKAFDYLFIANSSKKYKEKKVNREMEALTEKFFNVYTKDILEDFDGEISALQECEECFKEEIQDSLEEPVKDFWEGIINR